MPTRIQPLSLCVSLRLCKSQPVSQAGAGAAAFSDTAEGMDYHELLLIYSTCIEYVNGDLLFRNTINSRLLPNNASTPPPLPSSIFKALPQVPEPVPAPVMSNKRINLFFGGSQCWTFSWEMLVISGGRRGRRQRLGLELGLLLVVVFFLLPFAVSL